MGFLIDLRKLLGRKIISLFTWLFVYCFLFPLDSNFFTCSYLRLELSIIENNIIVVLTFFLVYVIYSYIIFSFTEFFKFKNTKLNNYINFKYLYNFIKYYSLTYLLNIFLLKLNINFKNIIVLYTYKFYIVLVDSIYTKLKNNYLVWYPIYKSYSIFGYYQSTRLKFVDLKNENFKNLKY
jgi:hypothetical protein